LIGLQDYIINNKMDVKTLANEINLSMGTIYRWFNINKVPSKYIKILADKFNIDEEYINKKINDTDIENKRGFNKYEIRENYAVIFIENKQKEVFEVKVDVEDINKLIEFDYRWYAWYNKNNQRHYARCSTYKIKKKMHTIMLHRFVVNADKSDHVDHENHDTLDNQKFNLRVTNRKNNARNRDSKNSNNKSGYRNVCWNKNEEQWMVQLMVDGRNTRLGFFNDVDKAGQFAEEMRHKYYGEYAGLT
jgi:hypothetical protein